jgi:hypothetical protein
MITERSPYHYDIFWLLVLMCLFLRHFITISYQFLYIVSEPQTFYHPEPGTVVLLTSKRHFEMGAVTEQLTSPAGPGGDLADG